MQAHQLMAAPAPRVSDVTDDDDIQRIQRELVTLGVRQAINSEKLSSIEALLSHHVDEERRELAALNEKIEGRATVESIRHLRDDFQAVRNGLLWLVMIVIGAVVAAILSGVITRAPGL